MTTETIATDITITRLFNAPRELVWKVLIESPKENHL